MARAVHDAAHGRLADLMALGIDLVVHAGLLRGADGTHDIGVERLGHDAVKIPLPADPFFLDVIHPVLGSGQ
ncbi:MAG: hypothetical protein ACK55I_31225, partial [bacterium]